MQMKKIIATVAAAALAVSAMAVSAFAGATSTIDDEHWDAGNSCWQIYAAADPDKGTEEFKAVDPTLVYGFTYNVTFDAAEMADEETWIGGGFGLNSESTGWAAVEWGKASGEKPVVLGTGLTQDLTYTYDAACFQATDTYAQVWLQAWGGNVVVNALTLLDKDGNALGTIGTPVAVDVDPGEPEVIGDGATVGDTDAAGTADKGNADTGVEGVAVVAGLAIVAAGAIVVAKKRK